MIEEIPINSENAEEIPNEIKSGTASDLRNGADVEAEAPAPQPKKRGRPAGSKSKAKAEPKPAAKKKRNAPPPEEEESEEEEEEVIPVPRRRRQAEPTLLEAEPPSQVQIPDTQAVALQVLQMLSNRSVDQSSRRRAKYASWFQNPQY